MICNKLDECYSTLLKEMEIGDCTNKNRDVCIEFSDNRTNAKCEENKKKYTIHNKNKERITLYKIDGGAITVDSNTPVGLTKCDYLFCVNSSESVAVLVELKGTDVKKALQQIKSTYFLYKEFFAGFDKILCRIIVTNSTPHIKADPVYVTLQKEFKRKCGDVIIATRELTENI